MDEQELTEVHRTGLVVLVVLNYLFNVHVKDCVLQMVVWSILVHVAGIVLRGIK